MHDSQRDVFRLICMYILLICPTLTDFYINVETSNVEREKREDPTWNISQQEKRPFSGVFYVSGETMWILLFILLLWTYDICLHQAT